MRALVLAARAPFVLALGLVLAMLLARSSLVALLPFAVEGLVLAYLAAGALVALSPALLARETPVPAAMLVTVPALAASAYGASRLDWLRLLKDFGVAEGSPVDFGRLALAATALVLVWGMHAADLAMRLRGRAVERGVAPEQADAAARVVLLRSGLALGIALAGAAGLLVVALIGVRVGDVLPTERGAFVVPLLAAGALVAAAVYLVRERPAS